jgi:hypothetical protein
MDERWNLYIHKRGFFDEGCLDSSYWRKAWDLWGRSFWKKRGRGYCQIYSIYDLALYILRRAQLENIEKNVFIDSFIEGFGGWDIYFVNYGIFEDRLLRLNKVKIYKVGGKR